LIRDGLSAVRQVSRSHELTAVERNAAAAGNIDEIDLEV
jgi:hypothetical protein